MNWPKRQIAVLAMAIALATPAAAWPATGTVLDQVLPGQSSAPAASLDGAPAATAAGSKPKTMWGPTTFMGASMFPTYNDLGVDTYATTAHWDQIAPTKPVNPTDPTDPAYKWPDYIDFSITEAQKYGMQILILFRGTPPWANGGQGSRFAATNIQDWTNFVTALTKKYPGVHLWMVWGEPNRQPNFGPFTASNSPKGPLNRAQQIAPRTYAQLLDSAYGALKAASASNQVIGGNTYTSAGKGDINPYAWIRYMKLPDGSPPRMDYYGHNPYGFHIPNLKDPPSPKGSVAFGDLRRLVKAIDKAYPGQGLKLYLAEWGVPIGYKDIDLTYSLKAKEGKQWIKAGFRIANTYSRIFSLGWVHPIDTSYSSQGLLDKNGSKKAGYNVYKSQ